MSGDENFVGKSVCLARSHRAAARQADRSGSRSRAAVANRFDLRLDVPTIVVGGTNGKGSTCAMLDAMLRAAGYRVGLYTSPHLLRFNERARIDGVDVSDDALIAQFEAVEAARGDITLTYFEFTTLAILRLFSQRETRRCRARGRSRGPARCGQHCRCRCFDRHVGGDRSCGLLGDDARADRLPKRRTFIVEAGQRFAATRSLHSRCSITRTRSAPTCGASATISTIKATVSSGRMRAAKCAVPVCPIPRCAAPINC